MPYAELVGEMAPLEAKILAGAASQEEMDRYLLLKKAIEETPEHKQIVENAEKWVEQVLAGKPPTSLRDLTSAPKKS